MTAGTGEQVEAPPARQVERTRLRASRWDALGKRVTEGRWHASAIGAIAVALSALCLSPLLDGPWWFSRVVAIVVVISVVGGLSRSARVPAPLTPLLQFAALLAFLAGNFAREDAQWGVLPGPTALAQLRDLAARGQDYAITTRPPAGPDLGLLLLIVAGIGLAALAVDTLAAGLDLPGMTLIPLAALYLVPWVVAHGSAPWWAFPVVALGWLAILSALQRDRAALWSPGARPGSPGTGMAIAGAVTVLALAAGNLGTLRGPAEPVGPATGTGGDPVQIDAMVSLRRSLISNDTRPVMTFAATTSRPEYLRLAVLENFDGEVWRPVAPNESGPLPPPLGDGSIPSVGQPPAGQLVDYQLDVGPLTGSTLPSPAGTFASLNDWTVVWDQRTSLPMRADGAGVQGTRISVVAAEPPPDSSGLRTASTVSPRPEQVFAENLADPGPLTGTDLPRLAAQITRDSSTPFDAAVALQRWFTEDGRFTYSTQVDGGSGGDALDDFLEERVGYCEQFAATMALMARSVGIPARVVVGFTHGHREGNQWVVLGTDAHAWPELWMGSSGWLRFEPTPGASNAAPPNYTRDTDQDGDTNGTSGEASAAPSAGAQDTPRRPVDQLDEGAAASGTGQLGLPVGSLLLAATLGLLLLPALIRVVRRRSRLHIGNAESAYHEVVDTMVDLRLASPATTPRSTLAAITKLVAPPGDGDVAGADSPDAAASVQRIRRAVEWQRFGRAGSAPLGHRGGTAAADRPEPESASPATDPGPAGELRGAALATKRHSPTDGDAPPLPVPDDVHVVRRALARRAGWTHRVVAVAAPMSVIAPLFGRGPEQAG